MEELNEKLPITLVLVVRNAGGRLKDVIEKHRGLVSEVVVVDQSSDDGTWEEAKELADLAVQRRNKGKCEGDRNFAFSLGNHPWCLNLDDDEYIDQKEWPKVKSAIELPVDIVWFKRDNQVDGLSMKFMGTDPQCRLFRRGAVRWHDATHKFPERADNALALYADVTITHVRTFDGIVKTHERRSKVLEPDMVALEESFIKQVREEFRKNGIKNA